MDSKKIVIIVLVIVAVVYFASVGTGFMPKKRDKTTKESYITESKEPGGGGGWESSLGGFMSSFAPRFDKDMPVTTLLSSNRTSCDSAQQVIQLSSSRTKCVIVIPKFDDEKFRKARLSFVQPYGATVQVKFTSNEKKVKDESKDMDPLRLSSHEPVDVTVMASGGTLELTCSGCSNTPLRVRFE